MADPKMSFKADEELVEPKPDKEKVEGGIMATPSVLPVVTSLTAMGIAQEAYVTGSGTAVVTYTPTGTNNFITIKNAGADVTVSAVCKVPCSMPLACANAAGVDDAGLHNFVMKVTSADAEKSFVIPYLDHYIDSVVGSPTYGMVTLNCDANMQDHGLLGIFTVP
jgi:hypothetical protein